jgi:hypothetical protein
MRSADTGEIEIIWKLPGLPSTISGKASRVDKGVVAIAFTSQSWGQLTEMGMTCMIELNDVHRIVYEAPRFPTNANQPCCCS